MPRAAIVIAGSLSWFACAPPEAGQKPQAQPSPADSVDAKRPDAKAGAIQPLCKACPGGPAPASGQAIVQAVRKLQATCGAPGETVWVVEYRLPGEKPWRDQGYPVGDAAKTCLANGLTTMDWPSGHSAELVAYDDRWGWDP